LAQTCRGHHAVGAAHQKPAPAPVARAAPGQTPGAAPPGCDPPPPCAIPACHAGRLERRAALPEPPRRDQAPRTTADHAPAALHARARRVADRDALSVAPGRGGDAPGRRLPPHLPPPSAPRDDAHHWEHRRARGVPSLGEQEAHRPPAGDDLGHPRGGVLRRARAAVDPEQHPAPPRHGGMEPRHLARTQCGMGCLHLDAGHGHLAPHLVRGGLRALGRAVLQARHRVASHRTNSGGPRITDAPPLPWHPPYDRVCGALAAGHQGALPFRARPAACRTAPAFAGRGRPCPRPMREVPFAGTIAPCPGWSRARESRRALWRWRRQSHSGPPMARNGLQDTGSTPVSPRYYSPGLPYFDYTNLLLCAVSTQRVPNAVYGPHNGTTHPAELAG